MFVYWQTSLINTSVKTFQMYSRPFTNVSSNGKTFYFMHYACQHWFSHSMHYDYLFNAFNISMVTSTDKAIVIGSGALNMRQSMSGKFLGSAGHCIWCV